MGRSDESADRLEADRGATRWHLELGDSRPFGPIAGCDHDKSSMTDCLTPHVPRQSSGLIGSEAAPLPPPKTYQVGTVLYNMNTSQTKLCKIRYACTSILVLKLDSRHIRVGWAYYILGEDRPVCTMIDSDGGEEPREPLHVHRSQTLCKPTNI